MTLHVWVDSDPQTDQVN